MDQTRRRTSRRWLLAVPALTGAAGGAAALAADIAVLVTALGTAAVLWRAGRRSGGGLHGWTLLSLALLLGLAGSAVAGVRWPGAESLSAAVPGLVHVPAVLLALAGVLTLLTRAQLRAGGARLATETALFFSAAMVLAQVLVVGPVAESPGLDAAARTAVELSCGATAALLSAVLVLVSASPEERRSTGALLLLATSTMVAGRVLDVVAQAGQPVPAAAAPAALIAGLLLIVVAVLRDRGPDAGTTSSSTARATRLGLAGQLLPHLVTVLAALAFVGSAVLGASHTPTAASAVLAGLVLTAVHRAVTARDEARVAARLHRSESYFRSLVRTSSDAVLILDGDLRVTWAAPALADAVAATGTELRGNRLTAVVHPDDAEPVATWLTGTVSGAGPTGLRTFRLPAARGCWRVLEAGVSDLRADADVAALVLHCRDVTARLDREDELHSIAFIDPLTGLPNRAAQLAALGSRLGALNDRAATRQPGDPDDADGVSLLMVELQDLHELHDLAGGDLVDHALVEVARRLRGVLRSEDQVARVGAESFSILALGTSADADRVASRCLSVIEQPLVTDVGLVDLTAALGLVPLAADLSERDALDRAQLAVRAAGPGTVRRWSDALGAARDRQDQLRRDLVGARERGELTLAWQPIVALSDHRVTGIEASPRWRHPVYGDVPPEEFLAVAARAGLEVDLQRWVLREATMAAAGLPDHEPALKLGVDVSVQHLAAGTLVGDVAGALEASGLPPERLVVEICEAAVAVGGEREAADVAALRLMGVHLALDDFGSGKSSLSQITRLPIDVLKLDRSFLSRIDRDRSTRAVCEAVVGIGASIGVDIVAQGVETTAQLAVLEQLGCGYVQGFLLSRPVGTAALVELLDRGVGQLWPGVPGRV